jgi:hypothetical protein
LNKIWLNNPGLQTWRSPKEWYTYTYKELDSLSHRLR